MLELWKKILKMLGFKSALLNSDKIETNVQFNQDYNKIDDVNVIAMVAKKIAMLTFTDSEININGNNLRADYMRNKLTKLWKTKTKKIITNMLGNGGVFVFPYVNSNGLYFSIVSQNKVSINKVVDDTITSITMLVDSIKVGSNRYYKWQSYNLDLTNQIASIEYLVTNEHGIPTQIEQWSDLQNHYITGVKEPLFAYFKLDVDARNENNYYGVPFTFGSNKTIQRIIETLKQIDVEFKNKEVKIFADERMFNKDSITSTLFKKLRNIDNSKSLMEIFSPDIRDSNFYNKLENQFKILEKELSVSQGVFSTVENNNVTATEIKLKNLETYAVLNDIRGIVEDGFASLKYSSDVFLNYFNLVPMGEYDININWSYLLVENSSETWTQLIQALNARVVSRQEIRNWLYPQESKFDSDKAIELIDKTESNIDRFIGL